MDNQVSIRLLSGIGVVNMGSCQKGSDELAEESFAAAAGVVNELEEDSMGVGGGRCGKVCGRQTADMEATDVLQHRPPRPQRVRRPDP